MIDTNNEQNFVINIYESGNEKFHLVLLLNIQRGTNNLRTQIKLLILLL